MGGVCLMVSWFPQELYVLAPHYWAHPGLPRHLCGAAGVVVVDLWSHIDPIDLLSQREAYQRQMAQHEELRNDILARISSQLAGGESQLAAPDTRQPPITPRQAAVAYSPEVAASINCLTYFTYLTYLGVLTYES
jgi:hypothetical protein